MNPQRSVRRDDVYVIGFDRHVVRRLFDRHGSRTLQQLGQEALMLWIQVLDQYERQTGIVRQALEQTPEGIQTAGGRPDTDHGNAA